MATKLELTPEDIAIRRAVFKRMVFAAYMKDSRRNTKALVDNSSHGDYLDGLAMKRSRSENILRGKRQFLDFPWKIREIGFYCYDGTFSKSSPYVDIVQDRSDGGPGCAMPVATKLNLDVAEHIVRLHNASLAG